MTLRTLILVPTQREREGLEPSLAPALHRDRRLDLCGFGPVAAAARTATLLERHRPGRVILVGIAGGLDDRLAIGRAYRFSQVACHGIGVGARDDFLPAGAMGWHHWPGDAADGSPAIGDVIACSADRPAPDGGRLLLTACAASAGPDDVRSRKRLFPAAAAEDMEGFAVAFACRLQGVPCDIVRGISNTAGDRDQAGWQVAEALRAAGALTVQVAAEES